MKKRFSRFSRRSIVGAVVGLAFAAAAGVGLAQITAEPSTTVSALSATTQSTGTQTSSNGREDDFDAQGSEADDNELEFEQAGTESTSSGGQTTSTIAGALTTTSSEGGNGQEKVDVCHVTGSGKSHTINIARPAVAAHVAQGDTEGACAETTTTTVAATSVAQSTTTTTAHVKKPKHVQTSSHGNSGHTSHGKSHSSHGKGKGK